MTNPTPTDGNGEMELRARIRQEIVSPSIISEVSTSDIAVGMLSSTAVSDRVEGIARYFLAWHHQQLEAKVTEKQPGTEALLAENKRLIEAGDRLYERASYTGRTFDGTHRLLSAAAHWLDTRGKNSGPYQAHLTNNKTTSHEGDTHDKA